MGCAIEGEGCMGLCGALVECLPGGYRPGFDTPWVWANFLFPNAPSVYIGACHLHWHRLSVP